MRVMTFIGAAALSLMLAPAPASAQWYVTPYVGGQFEGAANTSFVQGIDADTQPWNLGVSGGWMKGWLGIDADLAYHPGFFDNSGGFMTDTSLMTFMGNARVAIPWGARLRPYATGGAGLLRPNLAEAGGLAKVDDVKFAWNVGGGAIGSVSEHVGIQGDVRYFRSMDDAEASNAFGVNFDGFNFVRASVGVAFQW